MKEFTKQDLQPGMWVETRNGCMYYISLKFACGINEPVLVGELGLRPLASYRDDLTSFTSPQWDILKVLSHNFQGTVNYAKFNVEWRREGAVTLTEEERNFLSMLNESECWIARNKNGALWIFTKKPDKDGEYWDSEDLYLSVLSIKKDLFPFIKWEDEEPYLVKELLEWEIKG